MELKRVILKPFCKDKFEVAQDYEITINGVLLIIQKGYKTNGADIPRFLWCFYPPNSPEYLTAVVIHDYLTDLALQAYKIDKTKSKELFKIADETFYEALKMLNVNSFKARLFYLACRTYHTLKYGG